MGTNKTALDQLIAGASTRDVFIHQLVTELRGMNVDAEHHFNGVKAETDDPNTYIRVGVRPDLTVELAQIVNGTGGVGCPCAELRNVEPMVAAAIIAGWVEGLGVNLGPGAL